MSFVHGDTIIENLCTPGRQANSCTVCCLGNTDEKWVCTCSLLLSDNLGFWTANVSPWKETLTSQDWAPCTLLSAVLRQGTWEGVEWDLQVLQSLSVPCSSFRITAPFPAPRADTLTLCSTPWNGSPSQCYNYLNPYPSSPQLKKDQKDPGRCRGLDLQVAHDVHWFFCSYFLGPYVVALLLATLQGLRCRTSP